jgi:hypothetical protein
MSNSYAVVSALIFALVAIAHEPVDSGDWAIQRVDEYIVGCPCRFYSARDLGLYAITAVAASHRNATGVSSTDVQRVAPLLSVNSLMRPRTEPDNAQNQCREDSNIKQCINHGSLHRKHS